MKKKVLYSYDLDNLCENFPWFWLIFSYPDPDPDPVHGMDPVQDIHLIVMLIKYKKKKIKKYEPFIQKSSLFLYKFWFSTISLNICQDIHLKTNF